MKGARLDSRCVRNFKP